MDNRVHPCSCLVGRQPGSGRISKVQVGRPRSPSGHSLFGPCLKLHKGQSQVEWKGESRTACLTRKGESNKTHQMAHDLPMLNLGQRTTWTAVIAYSFFQNPPKIFFIFKCLLELNQILLWQFKIENISKEYTNQISLLIWEGVMATLGVTCPFSSRRQVWAFKITFQNIHRKWIKITLVLFGCYAIVSSAPKFDYMVTLLKVWEFEWFFTAFIEVGSIKYFKTGMSSEHWLFGALKETSSRRWLCDKHCILKIPNWP